jgi:hypothetical protein
LRKPLLWLLLFTFFHGAWYAAIVHPWQAPDEYLHYEYMRLIDAEHTLNLRAEHRTSEIQRPMANSMWTFQHYRYRLLPTPPEEEFQSYPTPLGSTIFTPQPPLYYLLTLPLYWTTQSWPVASQLLVLRLFSILLQCATVWITYELAKLIFPAVKDHWFLLFPAAFVAILPQYTFISSSYNNDNLAPPLIAASMFMLIKGYKDQARLRWFVLASVLGVLAIVTKRTSIGILPILGLALIAYTLLWLRSDRRWVRIMAMICLVSIALLLIASILFLLHPPSLPPELARHLRLSPSALISLSSFLQNPSTDGNLPWVYFANFTLESFWGYFGWLTLQVPPLWISIFRWITLLLTVGLFIGMVRYYKTSKTERPPMLPFSMLLFGSGVAFSLLAMAAQYLLAPAYYPPQGRYLFPFVSSIAILGAWSWRSFWPQSAQRKALTTGWFFLAIFDIVCWGYVIIPAWYS